MNLCLEQRPSLLMRLCEDCTACTVQQAGRGVELALDLLAVTLHVKITCSWVRKRSTLHIADGTGRLGAGWPAPDPQCGRPSSAATWAAAPAEHLLLSEAQESPTTLTFK